MKEEEKHIAAFDLGTAKIALTVARVYLDDIQIIYYKEVPSNGIRNSSIINPVKAEAPIRALVEEAEKELGIKITQAVVGMPRHAVRVETATAREDRDENTCITQEEVDNLKSMAIDSYPLDDEKSEFLYGSVAQSFSTEEEFSQIESDVVGMVSPYLEGNFKIFIGKKRAVSNIDMAFNKLDIAITKKYFVPDVTAKAVLTSDEMENGVALIDFGAGVTSVSIYKNKIMRHYAAIPFAGRSITNDIKTEGGISEKLAENIKLAYGALMPNKLQTLSEKIIQINDESNYCLKQIAVKYLSEVITARTKEIFDAILYDIQESGFADSLASGVVITGGSAEMANCANFLKELSGYNVRMGVARKFFSSDGIIGIGDTSATVSLGMILAAKRDMLPNCAIAETGYIPAGVKAPVIEQEPVQEPEPEPQPEPVQEPAPEPVQETIPEPVKEPEPIKKPEPIKIPEQIWKPEPVKEPEPVREPEPVKEPEPVRKPVEKVEKEVKPKKDSIFVKWVKKVGDKMEEIYTGMEG